MAFNLDSIISTSQNLGKFAKGTTDIARTKVSIQSKENELKKIYSELGELYYKSIKDNSTVENAENFVFNIDKLRKEISDLKEKCVDFENENKTIFQKNILICPNCGKEVDADSVFCLGCGFKLHNENNTTTATVNNNVPMQQNNGITCPKCGTIQEDDGMFCINCGTKLHNENNVNNDVDNVNICPKCGAKINSDSIFCENCGAKISEENNI